MTDPELIAEKEYAREHGTEFNMNMASGEGRTMAIDSSRVGRKYLVFNYGH